MRNMLKVGLALMALAANLVHADWIKESDRYAMRVLEAQAEFQPESVGSYGLNEFDEDVIDLGPQIYQRRQAARQAMIAELEAALGQEKDERVRQDLQILIDDLRGDFEIEKTYRQYLLSYVDLHGFLFRSFNGLLDPRNDHSRYPAALVRLARYTGQEEGYTPLFQQARQRAKERFEEPGLVGPYIAELESDLGKTQSYVDGIRSVFERSGLTGWEGNFAVLEQQLGEYEQWLRDEILPRTREQNLLPEAVYAINLQNYGVSATPEELISQAQYSYQLLRSEMKALALQIAAQRDWKERDLVAIIRRMKQQQIAPEDVLATYQERLGVIEDIIRRENLVTLPTRDAAIRLATEAESAAIPASFMSPPQLINNTGQYGEFVLVQKNPAIEGGNATMDDWSHDAIIWALTVHEARPGHELQFSKLVENGTSLARAIFAFNSANAEGWGLYAESIMQEYLPLEGQLFNLYSRSMRAARMFLDPMVNTGQMSHAQARDFLMEQMAMSESMASSEADRYAFWAPGQATSYYFGYINLMRLRTELEIALGEQFDQRAFHDFILEQGLLPPELLRAAVLEKFVSAE